MKMTEKKIKKLRKLLKQWTRAEIMARHGGDFKNLEFIDYALGEVELRNKIRNLLYGTFNLIELGTKWGLLQKKKLHTRK